MLSSYIFTLALAGTSFAATPKAFEPASNGDLMVAFGSKLATNGVNIPRAQTAQAPTIGTSQRLFGTYAVIMTDPDIPGAPTDSKTGQFLHWIQPDLESAASSTTVAGETMFELKSTTNATAFATYVQPSPPNRALTTHRYIELLVNTTGNSATAMTLMRAGMSRQNFSALNVVNQAGVQVLFANYFNVTNEAALAGGSNVTGETATGTGTGRGGASATGTEGGDSGSASGTGRGGGNAAITGAAVPVGIGNSAMMAGIGALGVAMALL
ncbi:phosphatidylethanolamine-binding protein [Amylocarpus encephaloides]|uniref:Phosphatidylethanolamine-binding protein n=1 Tax=Amylocarpus encephaloides TaxID=45428 RepID=A0A9P7YE19_9HELO|nr:phosphatidylethanolamine-binding protein [Amylocarpus encephaloides]